MRSFFIFIIVAALAAGGYFVYTRFLGPTHACSSLGSTCRIGADAVSACERVLTEVRKDNGGEAADKLARCLAKSKSCSEAAGCATGVGVSALSKSMVDFVDGLRKGN